MNTVIDSSQIDEVTPQNIVVDNIAIGVLEVRVIIVHIIGF